MHSYSHVYDQVYASQESFEEDVTKIHDYIQEQTGVDTHLYRFPGGSSNQVSKVDIQDLIGYLHDEGIVYYDWNSLSGDAVDASLTPSELNDNILGYVHANAGDSVILMHDLQNNHATIEALPALIQTLKDEGYEICPIDDSTKPVQHVEYKGDKKLNYLEAQNYIEEKSRLGIVPGLTQVKELLRRLGNPQDACRTLHIAGTNGKGSIFAFVQESLLAAGYHVGRYISPTILTYLERYQLDRRYMTEDEFAALLTEVAAVIETMETDGFASPTVFEIETAVAFLYFARNHVDYVLLECGMGGSQDATNVLAKPEICVFAQISMDHMQYLGNTVSEIAGEKVGIMVPGVPVIYDGNDPDAAGVMREHAEKLGCPYYELKREDTEIHKITKDGIRFSLKDETYGDTVFDIPFIARYQVMNAALAVKTIQVLENQIPVSLEALKAGMAKTRWQGRMESVLPGVIVDGAHNEDGVEKFVETAEHFQKEFPLTLLFSAVDDKDYTDMIRTICSRIRFRHVIVTQVGGYRKVPVEELAEIFREDGVPEVEAIEDVPAAFERAVKEKGEDGMLFCVGSLYLVGEIKAVIRRKKL